MAGLAYQLLVSAGGVQGETDADDAGFARFGSNNFEPAMVGFDDLAADGQAKAEADVASGEKRSGCFLSCF